MNLSLLVTKKLVLITARGILPHSASILAKDSTSACITSCQRSGDLQGVGDGFKEAGVVSQSGLGSHAMTGISHRLKLGLPTSFRSPGRFYIFLSCQGPITRLQWLLSALLAMLQLHSVNLIATCSPKGPFWFSGRLRPLALFRQLVTAC